MGKGSGGFLGRARVKPTHSKDNSVVGSKHGGGEGEGMKLEGPLGSFECWARGERSYLCRRPAGLWLIYVEA